MTAQESKDPTSVTIHSVMYGLFALERKVQDATALTALFDVMFVSPPSMRHLPVLLVPRANLVDMPNPPLPEWKDDTGGLFDGFVGFRLDGYDLRWPRPAGARPPTTFPQDQPIPSTPDCGVFDQPSLTLLPDLTQVTGGRPRADRARRVLASTSLAGGALGVTINTQAPVFKSIWGIVRPHQIITRPVAGAIGYQLDVVGSTLTLEVWTRENPALHTTVVLDASKTGSADLRVIIKNVPAFADQKPECQLMHYSGLYALLDGSDSPVPSVLAICDNGGLTSITCQEYEQQYAYAIEALRARLGSQRTPFEILNADQSQSCGGGYYDV